MAKYFTSDRINSNYSAYISENRSSVGVSDASLARIIQQQFGFDNNAGVFGGDISKITNDQIKSNLDNIARVSQNKWNYAHERNTSYPGVLIDYANTILDTLHANGGAGMLKFMGIQSALMLMNPAFDFLPNPLVY